MTMTPDERKEAIEERRDLIRKIRLAQRYQLRILCPVCLNPCILEGYDARGEGGRWQCRNVDHRD